MVWRVDCSGYPKFKPSELLLLPVLRFATKIYESIETILSSKLNGTIKNWMRTSVTVSVRRSGMPHFNRSAVAAFHCCKLKEVLSLILPYFRSLYG